MDKKTERVAEIAAQRDEWEPPAHLSKQSADIWRETVQAVSPEHFVQSDLATLARFCDAEARLRRLVKAELRAPVMQTDPEKRKAHRVLVTEINTLRSLLGTMTRMLRIAPSSRDDRSKRTEMPTRNPQKARRAARKPGDDLFAC